MQKDNSVGGQDKENKLESSSSSSSWENMWRSNAAL